MFGSGNNSTTNDNSKPTESTESGGPSTESAGSSIGAGSSTTTSLGPFAIKARGGEKRGGNGSPPRSQDRGSSNNSGGNDTPEKKRRSSGVSSKASSLIASAKNSLSFGAIASRMSVDLTSQTPIQRLGRTDPTLVVPQGQHNNSAGESLPGPRSTFRIGVWEDRNRKCRRSMEDTHAFLYNFLSTPAPVVERPDATMSDVSDDNSDGRSTGDIGDAAGVNRDVVESDNGYFAVFDGHAGTFAADWCGKKVHIILEELVRSNPNTPLPELLDQTFTSVDAQLEKLPARNSGCTAAVAVLRWEDRVPLSQERSATGSQPLAPAVASEVSKPTEAAASTNTTEVVQSIETSGGDDNTQKETAGETLTADEAHAKLKQSATRQRVLYTANVGDARIVLCRSGKALRLSYDHKGSDENETRRITNAGGVIMYNRVNGMLAVTRALGDTYVKDLVTGHPFTTETVINPDTDEFFIIACDGVWDVVTDQEAVDLIRDVEDPHVAAKMVVNHALDNHSLDNISCMIVRMDRQGVLDHRLSRDIGVDTDLPPPPTTSSSNAVTGTGAGNGSSTNTGKVSELDIILAETKANIAHGRTAPVGVSGTNSGVGLIGPREAEQEAEEQREIEERRRQSIHDAFNKDVSGSNEKKSNSDEGIALRPASEQTTTSTTTIPEEQGKEGVEEKSSEKAGQGQGQGQGQGEKTDSSTR